MVKKIKEQIKKMPKLHHVLLFLYYLPKRLFYRTVNLVFENSGGIEKKDKRFYKIESLKGKYKGKRCFIIATGPSLTIDDLSLMKDEVTISMNSIIKFFDRCDFRPTIYMTQDNDFFSKSKDQIMNLNESEVYIGINNMGRLFPKIREAIHISDLVDMPNANTYNLNLSYNYFEWRYLGHSWKKKFSFDAADKIYDGGTVTYSAIQLAVYMGCKDVYLVGVDNGTKKGQKYHATDTETEGKKLAVQMDDGRWKNFQDTFVYAYDVMKKNGIHLYNATRGGNLEGVPRVSLDLILEEDTKK